MPSMCFSCADGEADGLHPDVINLNPPKVRGYDAASTQAAQAPGGLFGRSKKALLGAKWGQKVAQTTLSKTGVATTMLSSSGAPEEATIAEATLQPDGEREPPAPKANESHQGTMAKLEVGGLSGDQSIQSDQGAQPTATHDSKKPASVSSSSHLSLAEFAQPVPPSAAVQGIAPPVAVTAQNAAQAPPPVVKEASEDIMDMLGF